MARAGYRYRGKQISMVDVQGSPQLFIDGEHIRVQSRGRAGRYWSKHVPYQEFGSLKELAQAIVDYRALDQAKLPKRKGRAGA